ncbi:chitin-binding protein [Halovenus sp. WSH3]|uniref:Chitin-binding protein n=1 Tax=Halovenus carboxidivorans TaxID=2692199 RepID=A0A6B0TBI3_9EURY|nr:right-handed parallel beta-helix repeat-containing protein [Halovenus carboxidivorans]MXR52993.1 chitin-binding protein [Halovenus carboxidivorans]
MTEDQPDRNRISRRHALAVLGTGAAALISGSEAPFVGEEGVRPARTGQLTTDGSGGEQPSRNGTECEGEACGDSTDHPGESITAYGALSDPDDQRISTAERNLRALLEAARAAGRNGTVYIPSGTYYIGHDGSGPDPFVRFGGREPPGISIVGAGPEVATLAISEHTPPDEQPNQSGLMWEEGYDHGTITVENVRLHGNYEALPNLSKAGGGSWGLQTGGRGRIRLHNAYISGWHLAGLRGRHMVERVERCTFEDNGIGVHNDANGDANSHHISVRPRRGTTCRIRNCQFLDCAGNVVNIRYNDGRLRMVNCHATGTGSGLCKLSGGSHVVFRHVYHEGHTDSLEQKVDERPDGPNFYGRNCINSLGERGSRSVTLRTEHLESWDTTEYALQSRGEIGNGPPAVKWVGDMVAIHNANMTNGEVAIRNREGGSFDGVEFRRLSVHGSSGDVFSTTRSSGRIETLHRDNAGGLGNPGDITIETDREGADPFVPEVPDAADVGINSS